MVKLIIIKGLPFKWRRWLHLFLHPMSFTRIIASLLLPLLVGMLIKRNDYSFRDDLHYLIIFTFCIAIWWYLVNRKRSSHA